MTVIIQHLLAGSEKLNANLRGVEPLRFAAFHLPLSWRCNGSLPGEKIKSYLYDYGNRSVRCANHSNR